MYVRDVVCFYLHYYYLEELLCSVCPTSHVVIAQRRRQLPSQSAQARTDHNFFPFPTEVFPFLCTFICTTIVTKRTRFEILPRGRLSRTGEVIHFGLFSTCEKCVFPVNNDICDSRDVTLRHMRLKHKWCELEAFKCTSNSN